MLKTMLWIAFFICLAGAGIAALVLLLINFRETAFVSEEFFRQTMAQIVSGIASGVLIAAVSFLSAYAMYRIQDENKAADTRIDSFTKILNEVSANRLTLEVDMKTDKLLIRLPLKTAAWEAGKDQTPIHTPQLIDGLKLLYDEIDRYNWQVNYFRFLVMERGVSKERVPLEVWTTVNEGMVVLRNRLSEFEKLTCREAVLLGRMRRTEYERRFGPWQNDVTISFFELPKPLPAAQTDVKSGKLSPQ